MGLNLNLVSYHIRSYNKLIADPHIIIVFILYVIYDFFELWSDYPDWNDFWSDFPDRNDLWSEISRPKSPLIRLSRPRGLLVRPYPDNSPDYSALMIRLKLRLFSRLWLYLSEGTDLWSGLNQIMVQTIVRSNRCPDPVISVWEHTGVHSSGSDHSSMWVWTSSWGVQGAAN